MFEKLFGKVSDVVYHRIGPYVAERQQFLEHCAEQRFGKRALEQIAGVLLTAATDLHAHGGLDVDHAQLESAATRIEKVRTGAGFGRGAREYRRAFLRITARWLRFIGSLRSPAARPRPYTALLDDFAQWSRGCRSARLGRMSASSSTTQRPTRP